MLSLTQEVLWLHLLEQGTLWETEGALRDAVHVVQLDPLDLLTAQQDEVVLEDQESVVRDDDEALLFIVPVIDPETDDDFRTNSSI